MRTPPLVKHDHIKKTSAATGDDSLQIMVKGDWYLVAIQIKFDAADATFIDVWTEPDVTAPFLGSFTAIGLANEYVTAMNPLEWQGRIPLSGVNIISCALSDSPGAVNFSMAIKLEERK